MKTDKEQLAFAAMKIELAKNEFKETGKISEYAESVLSAAEFYEKQIIELQIALNLIGE